MVDFFLLLSEPLVRFVLAPLSVVVAATLFKYSTQNDKHASFNREMLFWGPNLCVSGLLALIVDLSGKLKNMDTYEIKDYLLTVLTLVIISVVFMYVMSIIIRKRGWITTASGWRYSWWGGIIIPDFIGLALLIVIYLVAG